METNVMEKSGQNIVEIPALNREEKEKERRRRGGFAGGWLRGGSAGRYAMSGAGSGRSFLGLKALPGFEALSSAVGLSGSLPLFFTLGGLIIASAGLALWKSLEASRSGAHKAGNAAALAAPSSHGVAGNLESDSLGYLKYANPDFAKNNEEQSAPAVPKAEAKGNGEASTQEAAALPYQVPPVVETQVPGAEQVRDALASQAGAAAAQLSPNVGGAASFGSVSNSLGSFAPQGIGSKGSGFKQLTLKPSASGKLRAARKSPVRSLAKSGASRRLGSRAFDQLKDVSKTRPNFAATDGAKFEAASEPFDQGRVAGTGPNGLSNNGAGVINSPSSTNDGTNFSGTGNGQKTNPDWEQDQLDAQNNAKGGAGMMIMAVIMLLAGLVLLYLGLSTDPIGWPLVIAGALLILAALAMAMKGSGKGQAAKDAGKRLEEQGQTAASETANEEGDAVVNNSNPYDSGAGTRAESESRGAAQDFGRELGERRTQSIDGARSAQPDIGPRSESPGR